MKKKRRYIAKDDVTSPTVQLESLMATMAIEAMEKRKIVIADVAGAYLQTVMADYVIVKVSGDSCKIMCDVNPNFRRYVRPEGRRDTLYMRLKKALYGCMYSALLWYRTFREHLEGEGFELNPYDQCVANKTINGHQCTIAWYVDDSKISHKDEKVIDKVIQGLESRFGKMTITKGNKHTFVGMDIEYNDDGTVSISMNDYIEECIEVFGKSFNGGATSPAKRNLFEIDEHSKKLSEKKSILFHHIVAKLLFVSKRARLDINLTISFLCSRVDKSTHEDWSKLERLLHYLHRTLVLKRRLGMKQGIILRN